MTQIIKKPRTKGKITADFGMKHYYQYYKKNSNLKVERSLYNKIIKEFNLSIIDLIINDNIDYSLPFFGSSLGIRKVKNIPQIKNGKLYNTSPVDWVATNKLWNEDEEAKSKKLLVRFLNNHTNKHVFRIFFKKYRKNFKNKIFYQFKSGRYFQRTLSARINDETKEKYDSYLLY